MNEQKADGARSIGKAGQGTFTRRGLLALAAALVVILALRIGLDVGGVRERLFGGIGSPRIASIAVLPFENLSKDPAQDSVAREMTAEITANLGQIGSLRVIAPASVSQYRKAPKPLPDIGRELSVDAAVEGSVLRSGDRVKLSMSLTLAPTNRRVWAQTYERDLRNVRDLQNDISRTIARAIKATLTPEQEARLAASHPVNPQAYEAYLRGRYGQEAGKAEGYLTQAAQLDAAFAAPHVRLASNYYWSNYFTTSAPADTYPKVKQAAERALSIDPTLAEAHRYLALVAQEYDWDFVKAEKEFKRALELNPNAAETRHLYSHLLLAMGRDEESRAEDRRAEAIDPMDASLVACFSWHAVATSDYEGAQQRAQRGLQMGSDYGRLFLGWSYELRGRWDEAIVELQKAVVDWEGEAFPTAALGHAYAAAGREREAREVLDRLLLRSKKEYVSAYEIAAVYAGLGDRDRAFDWLQRAYEERSNALARFRMDPRIRSLQSDSRFQELMRRMNFPQDRRE